LTKRFDVVDYRRVGRFVAEVDAVDDDEPFPRAFLAARRRLVQVRYFGATAAVRAASLMP
jgi:hypothetical protein